MKHSLRPPALAAIAASVLAASAAVLAACAVRPAPPPMRAYRAAPMADPPLAIHQIDAGLHAQFVACTHDCAAPTPKTPVAAALVPASAIALSPETKPAVPPPPAIERATVQFPHASASLDAQQREALAALLPLARRAKSIRIVGRTDSVGGEGLNDRLAERRALAVMHFLRDPRHALDAKLSATGKGSCCYVADNASAQGRARNRRAEIEFELASSFVASAQVPSE